jgi:hypothetical protein
LGRAGNSFGSVGCAELCEHGADVKLDRPLGDPELRGDLFVAKPSRDVLEDQPLSRR